MSSSVAATSDEKFSRLPEIAKPISYEIYLKPDLKTFKFNGNETIVIDVTSSTDYLKLHSSEIEINSVNLKLADGTELKGVTFEANPKWMILTIKLPQKIEPQKVSLTIEFVGNHNDKMMGFYRSVYKGADGTEKHLVLTEFESTSARRAFPCYDEPIYKAKFDITLEVDEKLTALSNMNIVFEKPNGNGTKIENLNISNLKQKMDVQFEFILLKEKNILANMH
jgi:aminopeptidase N